MKCILEISMTKKSKEQIGFHCILTEIQLCFNSFGIEYVLQEVLNKIKENP